MSEDKIDMICTGGPFGDCCSTYKVVLHHEYTAKEYVEEILKTKPGEWGGEFQNLAGRTILQRTKTRA